MASVSGQRHMVSICKIINSLLDPLVSCGPASKEQIHSAQSQLGLLFPPSYIAFLQRYGAAFGNGVGIAGLAPDPMGEQPMWEDVVNSTLMYRSHNTLPGDSIYISTDGADHSYFLSCSKTNPDFEGKVIEWGPAHGGGTVYADSFISFVQRQVDR